MNTAPPPTHLVARAAGASYLVLGSYYMLRPVRDELASEYRLNTADWWLWVAGFAIVIMPLYSLLMSRQKRAGFSRKVFRALAVVLGGFAWFSAQTPPASEEAIGEIGSSLAGAYYVTASLYPMLVVSVLWSTLSECFDSATGKRVVGGVFAAGTIGGLSGSGFLSLAAAGQLGEFWQQPQWQLALAAVLLTLASFVVPIAGTGKRAEGSNESVSRKWNSGLMQLARSPYLLGVAGYLLLFTMGSGFLYFFQRDLIYDAYPDRDDRRAVLANLDFITQALTVLGQALVTGALLRKLGTSLVLLIMPIVTVIGFGLLAAFPMFAVFAGFSVLRRASNYAFAKPARELLFTVVTSEERYLTKPTLDVAVYRGGDVIASQTYEGLKGPEDGDQASLSEMCTYVLPFAAALIPLAYWLGRQQEKKAENEERLLQEN